MNATDTSILVRACRKARTDAYNDERLDPCIKVSISTGTVVVWDDGKVIRDGEWIATVDTDTRTATEHPPRGGWVFDPAA